MPHGAVNVLAYRIGALAYVTDAKRIPPDAMERLKGSKVLVINALLRTEHPTHLSIPEAIKVAQQEALFSELLLSTADQLRILRNPFAHRKAAEHEHTLGNRYIAQRRHPKLVLEEDARSAIVAMYGHFKHTLRTA